MDPRKSWVSRRFFAIINEGVLTGKQCIESEGGSEVAGSIHHSELKVPSSSS